MTASLAADRPELSGREVRRTTRRATAARADTSLWTRIGDTLGTLTSIAIGIALAGGALASLRDRIAAAVPATTAPAPPALPATAAAAVAALLGLAALVLLLDRLGPVSATPAVAAWWLPLPAGRRGLLAGDLARVTGWVVGVTALLALPPALALPARPTPGGVLPAVAGAAALGAAAVGATALLQTHGRPGRLGGVAGTVAVLAAVLAAGAATASALGAGVGLGTPLAVPAWAVLPVAVAAVLLLTAAVRGLDRLDAGALRTAGVAAQFAGASVLSLDTRDLGRALSARPRPRRTGRRFGWVRGGVGAVVAGDLATVLRGRWQVGQLAVAVAVPVLVAHTAGLSRLPVLVWLGCLLGWGLAAVAAGRPGREAHAAPELDRLGPLSGAQVLRAHGLLPLGLTAAVGTLSGLLVGAGTPAAGWWALLGLAAAPVWAAAALRSAYRPDLDWSGPVMATPLGPAPVGVGATLVQGPDVGVLGSLPVLLALLRGAPTPGLVGAQLAWSLVLAAGALAWLTRKGS